MKRFIYLLMVVVSQLYVIHAQEIKTVTIRYDSSDFSYLDNSMGSIEITSSKYDVTYGDDLNEPGLPFIPVNVAIPHGMFFSSFEITAQEKLIKENIVLAANPKPMTTNEQCHDAMSFASLSYAGNAYPSSSAVYLGTSFVDGFALLNFLVCPFRYDVQSEELYINEAITLKISLTESVEQITSSYGYGNNIGDIVELLVVNADEIAEYHPLNTMSDSDNDKTEYIIVTSSALSSSFLPIIRWKKTKGITSKIITIEEITSNYDGATIPLKIKSYLYDKYQNNGLKYVLLGGDDTVVPVQGCYGKVGVHVDNTIPTDLFYACFDGDFTWDADGDGIYGETTDSINMMPSIFVTRVPVRTSNDVEAFASKLLAYEKAPSVDGWNNNILMAGTMLWKNYSLNMSDAEAKGDNLYASYIMPYWNGTRKKFYDTYTDFTGDANYVLNSSNLQLQLGCGYTFFDMMTHGSQLAWSLESGLYNSSLAQLLKNNKFTIVTTMACLTKEVFVWPQGHMKTMLYGWRA